MSVDSCANSVLLLTVSNDLVTLVTLLNSRLGVADNGVMGDNPGDTYRSHRYITRRKNVRFTFVAFNII